MPFGALKVVVPPLFAGAPTVMVCANPNDKVITIKAKDSIFLIWNHPNKQNLKNKENSEFELLEKYVEFCVEKIRNLFIALKYNLDKEQWNTYSPKNPKGLLTVTFINGILNLMRLLIINDKISDLEEYKRKLYGINNFDIKQFKSSQYSKLGKALFEKYFFSKSNFLTLTVIYLKRFLSIASFFSNSSIIFPGPLILKCI